MKVGIYVRVSTQEQALNGHSIDEQTDRATKYCEAMRWPIHRIYTDPGQSGASLNRPALQQMILDAKDKRIDKVLVYKLDRLSRSQRDTLFLIEDVFIANQVEFVSMCENFDTSTAFGRAMIGILSVFAQLEREQIKERMTMGKEARAKEGGWNGGRFLPIGYDYEDGELKVNDYEAMLVRKIFDMAAENTPLSRIASQLNAAGMVHRYGKWGHQSIHRLLQNPIYIGSIQYSGALYEGHHEPLISVDQFAAVQEILTTRTKQFKEQNRRIGKATTLLGGFLVCAQCGAKYSKTTMRRKRKSGDYWIRSAYMCNSRNQRSPKLTKDPACRNQIWDIDELTDLVFGEIKKLALDPEYLGRIETEKDDRQNDDAEVIRSEIAKIESQIDRLLDLYTVGSIPVAVVQSRIGALNDKRTDLEDQLFEIEQKEKDRPSIEATMEKVRSFEEILQNGDFDQIRDVLASLISFVEIDGPDVTIHWNFA